MIYGLLSRLARVRFTVGYAAVLLAISSALLALGPHVHDVVVERASTNLHNLAHGRLGTLLGSALVVDAGPLYFWLPFLTCLLALAELHLRTVRLIVAFLVGHVGATLLVATALAAAVEFGWLPLSITRVSDVGMSYGALAVLGAMTAVIPRRWRPAWIGWWVSVGLTAAVIGADFTAAGHAVALLLGILVTIRFGRRAHWTPVRYALLMVSSGFGFLLLAHTAWTAVAGVVLGVSGALAVHCLARLTTVRNARLPEDALPVPEPVASP